MTETALVTSGSTPFDGSARSFLLRKLFSLTGVVPVGAFVLFHLQANAKALQGREAYGKMLDGIASTPFVTILEVVFIVLPILLHAAIGLKLVLDASYNVNVYGTTRNWMYTLQRAAGVGTIAFIAYHVYEVRWQKLTGAVQGAGLYDLLCRDLSSTMGAVPVVALVYVLGIAAVAFHLANGVWGFLVSWGITVSQRSQRLSGTVLGVLGSVVFLLGANTTVYFATGSKLFFPSELGSKATPVLQHCPSSVATPPP